MLGPANYDMPGILRNNHRIRFFWGEGVNYSFKEKNGPFHLPKRQNCVGWVIFMVYMSLLGLVTVLEYNLKDK